jgi:predicted RNA-binding protein with PUA-like domain
LLFVFCLKSMNYWIFKSEPHVFSFDDLRRVRVEPWSGVRNYQARNFMRDQMKLGDLGLFYHSSCPQPGVAGVLKIASAPYADPTQFEPTSEFFDPKATREQPRWQLVDVAWEADLPGLVSLEELRKNLFLKDLWILRKGNRLSITPLTEAEFHHICGQ